MVSRKMISLKTVLTFMLFAAVYCEEHLSYREFSAHNVDNLKDQICELGLLANIETSSKLACSTRCANKEECLSFFYNRKTGECKLHGHALDIDTCSWTPFIGSKYYRLNNRKKFGEDCGKAAECTGQGVFCGLSGQCECPAGLSYHPLKNSCEPGLIGQVCSNSVDCLVEQSECGDNKCRCRVGYSFSPSNQTCTKYCLQYGGTFERFQGYGHTGHNIEIISGIPGAECEMRCVNRTLEMCTAYEMCKGQCNLQIEDVSDYPADWKSYLVCEYYERNCL